MRRLLLWIIPTRRLSKKNIERIFKQKTIITIAHRLTTLKNADRILVFDAGKIVQEDNFKTLSETKGLFQTSFNKEANLLT